MSKVMLSRCCGCGGCGGAGARDRVGAGHRGGQRRGEGLVGRLDSRRHGPRRQRAAGAAAETVTDGQGGFGVADLAARARYRVEVSLDGFETARRRVVLETGQAADVEAHADTRALQPVGRRHGAPHRGSGAGSADSGVGGPRRPRGRRRRLQREPPEGNAADGAVLLDQPAQLGDQHPRPGRAVRPHQRRHRAGRRPLHRRRLLRASRRRRRSDFLDVEQVEVLRGPQGTLFGKNTTAGAINVTTRKPSFTPASEVELNYGNIGFVQAKASVTGPLFKQTVAGRISFSGTQRDGVLQNVDDRRRRERSQQPGHARPGALRAVGCRWPSPSPCDHTRQRPQGYTQVVAGVAPTLRPANRQYAADRGRPELHAAELQRVRPPDRRGHAAPLLSGPGRRPR